MSQQNGHDVARVHDGECDGDCDLWNGVQWLLRAIKDRMPHHGPDAMMSQADIENIARGLRKSGK